MPRPKPLGTPSLLRTHSLAMGLCGAYLLNDGVLGAFRNHAIRRGGTDLSSGAAGYVGNRVCEHGKGVYFDGTGYLQATNPLAALAPFSILTKFRISNLAGTGGIVSIAGTATDATPLYFVDQNSGTGTVRVLLGDVAYDTVIATPVAGAWYTLLSSISATIAGTENHFIYTGGSATLVVTNARTFGVAVSTNLFLGSGFSGKPLVDIECCYLWDRVLTYRESLDVIVDPYQMWEPLAFRVGRIVSAPPIGRLVSVNQSVKNSVSY